MCREAYFFISSFLAAFFEPSFFGAAFFAAFFSPPFFAYAFFSIGWAPAWDAATAKPLERAKAAPINNETSFFI